MYVSFHSGFCTLDNQNEKKVVVLLLFMAVVKNKFMQASTPTKTTQFRRMVRHFLGLVTFGRIQLDIRVDRIIQC